MAERGQRESSDKAVELKEQAGNENENKDMETSLKQKEKPERNNSSMSTITRQRGSTDREEETTIWLFDEDKSGELQEQPQEENTDEEPPFGYTWGALHKELQNLFKTKPNRTWTDRSKYFFMALVMGLLPTLFDIGTDGLSMFFFVHGTTYIKYVPDLNHPSVNCSTADEHCVWCKNIGRHLKITANTTEVVYEEFECFEKDPIWGYMTLFIIFFPGLFACMQQMIVEKNRGSNFMSPALGLLFLPMFPVFVIIAKILQMFNPGPAWTSSTQRFSRWEAKCESKLQFLLQLFIVFTRADRQPSNLQMASMCASFSCSAR